MNTDTTHRVRVWMPLYPGDYLASTGHLSTEEHGAYFLLMLHYWATGKPLPDDNRKLSRITKVSVEVWEGIRSTLSEFFEIGGGQWIHDRIEHEIQKAVSVSEKRQASGAEGGRRSAKIRRLKSRDAQANAQPNAEPIAKQMLKQTGKQNPRQSQSHKTLPVVRGSTPIGDDEKNSVPKNAIPETGGAA